MPAIASRIDREHDRDRTHALRATASANVSRHARATRPIDRRAGALSGARAIVDLCSKLAMRAMSGRRRAVVACAVVCVMILASGSAGARHGPSEGVATRDGAAGAETRGGTRGGERRSALEVSDGTSSGGKAFESVTVQKRDAAAEEDEGVDEDEVVVGSSERARAEVAEVEMKDETNEKATAANAAPKTKKSSVSSVVSATALTSEPIGRGTVAKSMPVPIPKATRLRVLVTGGAGFVGSHLVDRLMERGNIVIVADNFFTGRKENIMHHLQNPFFELIRHDVVEPMLVEVDQIYHLACPASPVHYKHNPVKTIKTSVMGTLNMLGLAKRVGARMLLTSTSEVYGDPLEHPQKETYWGNVNPIGVRSCYDEGKRVAETLCFDYHRQEGVDIRIARIFNTYGPRMALEDGRVVSNFVSQALRGEPLTVYGDGKQTRSFQYVDDLVAGLMALMDNEDEIGPVNIGNPGEFTMLELAEVVKEVVDKNAKIVFKENTADDPGRRQPDITLAKKALGWEPKITLREGLPKMVEDFRERLNLAAKPTATKSVASE